MQTTHAINNITRHKSLYLKCLDVYSRSIATLKRVAHATLYPVSAVCEPSLESGEERTGLAPGPRIYGSPVPHGIGTSAVVSPKLHIWGVLYRAGLYAAVSGKGSSQGIFLFSAMTHTWKEPCYYYRNNPRFYILYHVILLRTILQFFPMRKTNFIIIQFMVSSVW